MKLRTLCVGLLSLFVGSLLIWVNRPLIIWDKDSEEEQKQQIENSEMAVSKLVHTKWTAEELNGKSVSTFAERRKVDLRFDPDSQRFGAGGFCNGTGGEYEVNGDRLRFKLGPHTLMSCGETLDKAEEELAVALGTTTHYKVYSQRLKLYRYGQLLAQFKSEEVNQALP